MDLVQLVHQLGPRGRAAVAEQLGANAELFRPDYERIRITVTAHSTSVRVSCTVTVIARSRKAKSPACRLASCATSHGKRRSARCWWLLAGGGCGAAAVEPRKIWGQS